MAATNPSNPLYASFDTFFNKVSQIHEEAEKIGKSSEKNYDATRIKIIQLLKDSSFTPFLAPFKTAQTEIDALIQPGVKADAETSKKIVDLFQKAELSNEYNELVAKRVRDNIPGNLISAFNEIDKIVDPKLRVTLANEASTHIVQMVFSGEVARALIIADGIRDLNAKFILKFSIYQMSANTKLEDVNEIAFDQLKKDIQSAGLELAKRASLAENRTEALEYALHISEDKLRNDVISEIDQKFPQKTTKELMSEFLFFKKYDEAEDLIYSTTSPSEREALSDQLSDHLRTALERDIKKVGAKKRDKHTMFSFVTDPTKQKAHPNKDARHGLVTVDVSKRNLETAHSTINTVLRYMPMGKERESIIKEIEIFLSKEGNDPQQETSQTLWYRDQIDRLLQQASSNYQKQQTDSAFQNLRSIYSLFQSGSNIDNDHQFSILKNMIALASQNKDKVGITKIVEQLGKHLNPYTEEKLNALKAIISQSGMDPKEVDALTSKNLLKEAAPSAAITARPLQPAGMPQSSEKDVKSAASISKPQSFASFSPDPKLVSREEYERYKNRPQVPIILPTDMEAIRKYIADKDLETSLKAIMAGIENSARFDDLEKLKPLFEMFFEKLGIRWDDVLKKSTTLNRDQDVAIRAILSEISNAGFDEPGRLKLLNSLFVEILQVASNAKINDPGAIGRVAILQKRLNDKLLTKETAGRRQIKHNPTDLLVLEWTKAILSKNKQSSK